MKRASALLIALVAVAAVSTGAHAAETLTYEHCSSGEHPPTLTPAACEARVTAIPGGFSIKASVVTPNDGADFATAGDEATAWVSESIELPIPESGDVAIDVAIADVTIDSTPQAQPPGDAAATVTPFTYVTTGVTAHGESESWEQQVASTYALPTTNELLSLRGSVPAGTSRLTFWIFAEAAATVRAGNSVTVQRPPRRIYLTDVPYRCVPFNGCYGGQHLPVPIDVALPIPEEMQGLYVSPVRGRATAAFDVAIAFDAAA